MWAGTDIETCPAHGNLSPDLCFILHGVTRDTTGPFHDLIDLWGRSGAGSIGCWT